MIVDPMLFSKEIQLINFESIQLNAAARLLAEFEPWPNGTKVSYNYRGSVHYGTIAGVHTKGKTHGTTSYSVRPHQHFKGETATIHRLGSKMHKVSKFPKDKGSK